MVKDKSKAEVVNSVDGRKYPPNVEDDLNSKANALFAEGIGKKFLQYLEGLTTNNVMVQDWELRVWHTMKDKDTLWELLKHELKWAKRSQTNQLKGESNNVRKTD